MTASLTYKLPAGEDKRGRKLVRVFEGRKCVATAELHWLVYSHPTQIMHIMGYDSQTCTPRWREVIQAVLVARDEAIERGLLP